MWKYSFYYLITIIGGILMLSFGTIHFVQKNVYNISDLGASFLISTGLTMTSFQIIDWLITDNTMSDDFWEIIDSTMINAFWETMCFVFLLMAIPLIGFQLMITTGIFQLITDSLSISNCGAISLITIGILFELLWVLLFL